MTLGLKRYTEAFVVVGNPPRRALFGSGTEVRYKTLELVLRDGPAEGEGIKDRPGHQTVVIRATIEVEAQVTIVRDPASFQCTVCGAIPPLPDPDGMVFLLRNHDGARCVFPGPEDCPEERDSYPVPGWHGTSEGLTCPTCVTALKTAVDAVYVERRRHKEAP